MVGSNSVGAVAEEKDTPRVHTNRRKAMWGQSEEAAGYLQGRKKALIRKQLCQHLDLGLPAYRSIKIDFCGLKHPVYSILLWQPKKISTVVPFYSWGIHSKALGRGPKPQMVTNPIFTMFCFIHIHLR